VPTIDPRPALLDALVTHLTTQLAALSAETDANGEALVGIEVLRGWPEHALESDIGTKPELAVTAGNATIEPCAPDSVDNADQGDGTYVTQYRVGYLRVTVQLDLWCGYRVQRDAYGHQVEAALHNQVPFARGLWLQSTGYYSRPITAHVTDSRLEDDGQSSPRGQWRQTWTLDVLTDVVVEASHPILQQVDVDISTELAGVTVVEPTSSTTS